MVLAALVSFGLLLVAWIAAPTEARLAARARVPTEMPALAEAA